MDIKNRNIRIFLLGAVMYILVHSYLYSKFVEGRDLITKYRHYFYFLVLVDLAGSVATYFRGVKDEPKKKKLKNKRLKKLRMMNWSANPEFEFINQQGYQYLGNNQNVTGNDNAQNPGINNYPDPRDIFVKSNHHSNEKSNQKKLELIELDKLRDDEKGKKASNDDKSLNTIPFYDKNKVREEKNQNDGNSNLSNIPIYQSQRNKFNNDESIPVYKPSSA